MTVCQICMDDGANRGIAAMQFLSNLTDGLAVNLVLVDYIDASLVTEKTAILAH